MPSCRRGEAVRPIHNTPMPLEHYPGAVEGLERLLVVPWNDRYNEDDVDYIGAALTSAVSSVGLRKAS